MNRRTESLLKDVTPKMLIAVYVDNKSNWDNAYLESHEVAADGSVLEGRPLKEETISEMVDVFYKQQQERQSVSGIIPAEMLSFSTLNGGKYDMVWYNPPQVRNILFSKSANIEGGKAWVPGMIYRANKDQLSVFAYQGQERPDMETKLYRPPFFNVSSTGSVCLGSAKANKGGNTYTSLIQYWEDLFWLSEFSHITGSDLTKTNTTMLWEKLISDNTITWADIDELNELKQTLKDLI